MQTDFFSLPIMALTVYMESSGEAYRGMRATAAVIRNRAERRSQTILQVCMQPWQFSAWNRASDPNRKRLMDAEKDPVFWEAMRACLDPEDETDGATHYYALTIDEPYWAQGMTETLTLGHHRFLKEE